MSKFEVECSDIGVDYQDSPPWRSYSLSASGDTFNDLVERATITETDQDGGELNSYGISKASDEVRYAVLRILIDATCPTEKNQDQTEDESEEQCMHEETECGICSDCGDEVDWAFRVFKEND